MRKLILSIMVGTSFLSLLSGQNASDPASWSKRKTDEWFAKKEWTGGWTVAPDSSINKRELAVAYFKNRARWEMAFKFLKSTDLKTAEAKRYDIDGNNLFATVSEYISKNEENAQFEAHRKYIDIQYVIRGKEIMNVAPLTTMKELVTPYDGAKDIEFLTVDKVVNYSADPANFFIFFPSDAHRPGLKDGVNSPVRKVVIKLRVDMNNK